MMFSMLGVKLTYILFYVFFCISMMMHQFKNRQVNLTQVANKKRENKRLEKI